MKRNMKNQKTGLYKRGDNMKAILFLLVLTPIVAEAQFETQQDRFYQEQTYWNILRMQQEQIRQQQRFEQERRNQLQQEQTEMLMRSFNRVCDQYGVCR